MKKIIALLCASACTACLASCDDESKPSGDGSGHMYNAALLGNPESLDPQFADDASSNTVISNLYSGLMKRDESGNIVCCNAESYTRSEDELTYTFKLRQDNYWFYDKNNDDIIDDDEYFQVTAKDYVFAFRRLLDPEMKSPYSKEYSCIKGAAAVSDGTAPPDSVGVASEDDFTLVIQLEYASAEFINLLAEHPSFPCNEEFFASTKGRYGLDDRSVMSNGAFFVRQWFYDPYGNNNILYMKANTVNSYDDDNIYPSFLSFFIEKSQSDIDKLFKDGNIDCNASLSKGSYNTKKYDLNPEMSITLGVVFNPADPVYSNLNLHKALAYSLNKEEISEKSSSDIKAAYGVIPPAVSLLGRSYRELSSDRLFDIYDEAKAVDCLTAAKSELKTESFAQVKMLVATDTVDSSVLHSITQHWQDILGIYIGIEEVTSQEFESRLDSGDYKLALYPLRGSYNSGVSVLEKFGSADYLSVGDSTAAEIAGLRKCADFTEFTDKFKSAEKLILDEYSFIPVFYKNAYLITEKVNEDIYFDSFSWSVDFRSAKNYD